MTSTVKDIEETAPVEETEKNADENYESLKALVEALNTDFEKFQKKKVKAAGQRVRNNLLNCRKLCDLLRKQVLTDIKGIPIKHRVKATPIEDEAVVAEEKAAATDELPEEPLKLVRQTGTYKRTRKANKVKK